MYLDLQDRDYVCMDSYDCDTVMYFIRVYFGNGLCIAVMLSDYLLVFYLNRHDGYPLIYLNTYASDS